LLAGDWIDASLLDAPLVVISATNIFNHYFCGCVADPNSFGIDRRDREYYYGNNHKIILPEMAISRISFYC
jgi:hypothetical protein